MSDRNEAATTFRDTFIERVRVARKNRGLTQQDIATLLGLTQDTYKQYETRSLLPHYLVPRFCIACGVGAEWLFSSVAKIAHLSPKERLIRSTELRLFKLEHGLAMPRDPDAIARCRRELAEIIAAPPDDPACRLALMLAERRAS